MQNDAKYEPVFITEQEFRKRYDYDPNEVIGEGGFACVYKAYDRQFDEVVALKFCTHLEANKYDVMREMRNSRKFTHKNIIRVHDAHIIRKTSSYGRIEEVQVGVLEFANGGNFRNFLQKRPTEEQFKKVLIGILEGLDYLHKEKRIIHRDLSPDSILMFIEEGRWIPKIADFGISKQIDVGTINMNNQKLSSQLVGKIEYMAPEQFDPNKYGIYGKIHTNVDLWAFGIILTEIFTETSPFGDRNTTQSPMQIMHNVLHQPLPPQIKNIPEPYRKVIQCCLVKDARKRVQNSYELIQILSTPVQIQKKKKINPILVVGILALFIILGIGMWFWVNSKENSPVAVKKTEKTLTIINPSPSDGIVSPHDSIINDDIHNASGSKDKELQNENHQNDSLLTKKPSDATVQKADPSFSPKDVLFERLLREIKSLDNEHLYTKLRMDRIDRHIQQFFTGKDANVLIYQNGNIEEQKIEEFFKHVVNTAGTENRDWKINTNRTKLNGRKIATLSIEKI